MCLHPLRLPNKGYRPDKFYTSKYIDVNCNHCWQCKLQRQNDYCFRLQYQCLSTGAVPFFVTLTYNDKYLPQLEYYKDGQLNSLSVWNRTHVQRLNKIVRRQLSYYFASSPYSLSYLCACERGSDRLYIDSFGKTRQSTCRPHYHLLYIFSDLSAVPVRPLPSRFFEYLRASRLGISPVTFIQWLISDRWKYGFVDDVAFCRDTVSITKYITKYLTKDICEPLNFISPTSIHRLIDYDYWEKNFKHVAKQYEVDFEKSFDVVKSNLAPVRFCSFVPRSMCSINLGMSFVQNLSFDELVDYLSGSKKVLLSSRTSSSLIDLPYYYFRRLCKRSVHLPLNKWFIRYNGKCWQKFHTVESYKMVDDWDTFHGSFKRKSFRSYSETITTFLGHVVQRLKLKNKYRNFLSYITKYRNMSFDSLVTFLKYSECNDLLSLYYVKSPVLQPLSFRDFLSGYHFCNLSIYNDIVNTLTLCRLSDQVRRHLAFEVSYRKKIGKTGRDNPDLFLTHLI